MTNVIWIGHDRNEIRNGARLLSVTAWASGHNGSMAVFTDQAQRRELPFYGYTRIGYGSSDASLPAIFDYGIVLDDDIIDTIDIPVYEDGILIVNTSRNSRMFDTRFHTITMDASYLARIVTGSSDPHIAMLGAFTAISNLIRYEQSINAISCNSQNDSEKLITLFALSYGAVLSGRAL